MFLCISFLISAGIFSWINKNIPTFFLGKACFFKKNTVFPNKKSTKTTHKYGTTNRSMYPLIFKKPGLPYTVYLWIQRRWKASSGCKAGSCVHQSSMTLGVQNVTFFSGGCTGWKNRVIHLRKSLEKRLFGATKSGCEILTMEMFLRWLIPGS